MKLKPHEEFTVWRKRHNLSQLDLAERFNVSQGYISHMEMGIRPIPKKVREIMPKKLKLRGSADAQARNQHEPRREDVPSHAPKTSSVHTQ
jgi:transcriptional regulator with XRE-family HTH domain